ncbi:MAG: Lrp/AsnC ligand binding domain-containing protein [Muribaculaceae bacterium]|nr:Lrp/AsnC ligand binding domain-containing protein [Muribaculaceae bacterium]
MANQKLDSLDYKILKMLSVDARKPYLEIARACNVSGAAIHQRIQKLYAMGVINGSISLITPASVGYETCAYVGIFLNDSSRFEEVVEHLKEMPEVIECYFTTGKYDMFVKLYARNNDHLLSLIHDKFLQLGLGRTETLITFKEVFKRQIPIDESFAKSKNEN